MVFLRRAAEAAGYAAACAFDDPAPRRSWTLVPAFACAGVFSAALATLMLIL